MLHGNWSDINSLGHPGRWRYTHDRGLVDYSPGRTGLLSITDGPLHISIRPTLTPGYQTTLAMKQLISVRLIL
jgi:hypothetical protein